MILFSFSSRRCQLHEEKVTEIFPILGVVKLGYFGILAICSTLYGEDDTAVSSSHDYTDSRQNERIFKLCNTKYERNSM